MTAILKNIPISTIEDEFANCLNKITGFNFTVNIKDLNFETGETVLEVHVVDVGDKGQIKV